MCQKYDVIVETVVIYSNVQAITYVVQFIKYTFYRVGAKKINLHFTFLQ